jgi:hypothetical protein
MEKVADEPEGHQKGSPDGIETSNDEAMGVMRGLKCLFRCLGFFRLF